MGLLEVMMKNCQKLTKCMSTALVKAMNTALLHGYQLQFLGPGTVIFCTKKLGWMVSTWSNYPGLSEKALYNHKGYLSKRPKEVRQGKQRSEGKAGPVLMPWVEEETERHRLCDQPVETEVAARNGFCPRVYRSEECSPAAMLMLTITRCIAYPCAPCLSLFTGGQCHG